MPPHAPVPVSFLILFFFHVRVISNSPEGGKSERNPQGSHFSLRFGFSFHSASRLICFPFNCHAPPPVFILLSFRILNFRHVILPVPYPVQRMPGCNCRMSSFHQFCRFFLIFHVPNSVAKKPRILRISAHQRLSDDVSLVERRLHFASLILPAFLSCSS